MKKSSYKTPATYINPRIDEGFKILFGRESSKDILIGFLNDVLDNGDNDPIVDVEYLNKEMVRESAEGRTMFYDLHCKTRCNKRFLVEMQNGEQDNFVERSLLYMARCITEQAKPSDWDYEYMPVIGIFICDFKIKSLRQEVKIDTGLRESNSVEPITDRLRMIYIQLPMFNKKNKEDCENDFERWVYILKHMETMIDMAPFTAMKDVFKRVEEVGRVENLSKKERLLYDHNLKVYQDYYNRFKTAERKGMEKGMEKGKCEERAFLIKKMHSSGMSAESISSVTQIPIEEINIILGK